MFGQASVVVDKEQVPSLFLECLRLDLWPKTQSAAPSIAVWSTLQPLTPVATKGLRAEFLMNFTFLRGPDCDSESELLFTEDLTNRWVHESRQHRRLKPSPGDCFGSRRCNPCRVAHTPQCD